MTQGQDVTPFFHGRRMWNPKFTIGTGDLPLVNPSYSMQGEDLVVRNLLKAELRSGNPGTYIDLGAAEPCYASNTYLFYQHGWRGICVEPNPQIADHFRQVRPRDAFLNAAVGPDGAGYWARSVHHPSSSQVALTPDGFGPDFHPPIQVPFISMATLFSTFVPAGTPIDYASIDIEGFELAALQTNDWSRFKPKVILIEENNLMVTDPMAAPAVRFLCDLGYTIIATIYPNVILIAK